MSNLLIIWVATDQEHISGNSLSQHGLSCYAIVAKGQEYPRDVGGDDHVRFCSGITAGAELVEEIEDSFFNEYIDTFLGQGEVNESESAVLFDSDVLLSVTAELHDQIDDTLVNNLIKKHLVVGQQ